MADTFIVYVLHFDRPYWQAGKASCQHYVGYTKDLEARTIKHREGNGSKLVRYAMSKGINFSLVAKEVFGSQHEARVRELWIKKHGAGKRLCPLCRKVSAYLLSRYSANEEKD